MRRTGAGRRTSLAVVLDPDAAGVLAVVATAVALLALALAGVLAARLARLRRDVEGLAGDRFVRALRETQQDGDELRRDVARLRGDLASARADLSDALRHVAVVRYDAFGDMGGRLSFSAALLDDDGDGLVLTSINGRSETRTYAKGVAAGASGHELSPEEAQAIAYATGAKEQPDADLAVPRRERPSRR